MKALGVPEQCVATARRSCCRPRNMWGRGLLWCTLASCKQRTRTTQRLQYRYLGTCQHALHVELASATCVAVSESSRKPHWLKQLAGCLSRSPAALARTTCMECPRHQGTYQCPPLCALTLTHSQSRCHHATGYRIMLARRTGAAAQDLASTAAQMFAMAKFWHA
jgi:hypothetical protein